MSGSCHLDRASNVEIGVECQIFVIVFFFNYNRFYNLGHILGKGASTHEIIFSALYYFQTWFSFRLKKSKQIFNALSK
jgi:hypothetical protein